MMLIYKYNGFEKTLARNAPRVHPTDPYGATNLPITIERGNRLEERRGGITPRLTQSPPSLPKPLVGRPVIGLFFMRRKRRKLRDCIPYH